MKPQIKTRTIFDKILGFLFSLAGILLLVIMVSIIFDVFMRYFFKRPMAWVFEGSEYSLLYITFLGAAWVLRKDMHVKIDLVPNFLRPRARHILSIATSIGGAVTMLVVAVYSGQSTWELFQIGYFLPTVLQPPIFIFMAVIPIGSFLLFVEFLRRTLSYIRGLRVSEIQQALFEE